MASNRELKEEASALAAKLGIEISTEGSNNAGLTELVARLTAQVEARDNPAPRTTVAGGAVRAAPAVSEDTAPAPEEAPELEAEDLEEADTDPGPEPAPPTPVDGDANNGYQGGPPQRAGAKPARMYPYSVAPGKALCCTPRGILKPGAEVRACDFVDGQKQLDHLVERGLVVRG
jgi:hypothetical protein